MKRLVDQILLTYSSKASSLPPLSSQKQLKSIKNMVIAEALYARGQGVEKDLEHAHRKRRG